MTRPPLTEREHRLLSDWIASRIGLRFGPEKRDILRSRLDSRRAELGLESFEQLYFHLKFHPERETEWQRLVPHLTNNESYFFREPGQLDALRTEVMPALRREAESAGRRDLRILSAGCATGEEAYTLAITVRESGLFPAPWKVRVTGVDVDDDALCLAREAVYGKNSFRRTDPEIRRRYFAESETGSAVVPAVRGMAEFRKANLVDARSFAALPPQDVIFCRNVLIYFDDESMRSAVAALYSALRPGGYLFLGHAETLSRVPTRLAPQRRPGAIYYRRPELDDG